MGNELSMSQARTTLHFMLRQPINSLRRRPYAHPPREPPCRKGDLKPTPVKLTMTTRSQPWQEFGLSQRWSDKKRTAGSRYATDSAYSFPVRNKSSGAQSSAPVFYEATYKYNKNVGAELAILSGGLNNMLMMIAQLLTVSCADPNGVLLLPPMDIDPLRALMQDKIHQSTAALRTQKQRGLPVAPPPPPSPPPRQILGGFEDFFDLPYFRSHAAKFCGSRTHNGSAGTFVWTGEPPPGAHVVQVFIKSLGPQWDYKAYTPAMVALYGSLRPSGKVAALVEALTRQAVERAGPNWSAVHLPVQSDWWFETGWCLGRPNEGYTRRCYTPREVAKSTRDARRNATGTVLLFAHDKVATRAHPWVDPKGRKQTGSPIHVGPSICNGAFGPNTFKLHLPTSIPYLFRNAAEQFFAARAPAGFFGNSFSTFSKGIALLRDSGTATSCRTMRCQCFSYDCAQTDYAFWQHSAKVGIIPNHPGFWKLCSLSEFASGSSEKPGAGVAQPHCVAGLWSSGKAREASRIAAKFAAAVQNVTGLRNNSRRKVPLTFQSRHGARAGNGKTRIEQQRHAMLAKRAVALLLERQQRLAAAF